MSDERGEAGAPRDPEDASAGQDAAAQRAGGGADDERVREAIDELRRLRVEDLALDMAVSLVTVGYQKLGLTEQTREVRDLDGARLSIELLRACLDVLERERGAAGLGDLRATLSAMQINYARAVEEGRAAAAATSEQVGSTERQETGEQVASAEPEGPVAEDPQDVARATEQAAAEEPEQDAAPSDGE
jgi:hypothetical protein